MSFLKRIFGKSPAHPNRSPAALAWDEVNDVRTRAFEAGFGRLPQDIQKIANLFGVWPGGGLYIIPAPQLQAGAAIYTSFGLTNPDMPATLTAHNAQTVHSASHGGRIVKATATLALKDNVPAAREWPGYGYEVIVFAPNNEEWPLWLLQWAVQAEILNDAGLRDRVEKYGGMTVESVKIADNASVHLLLAKAQAPLMTHLDLPTGRACVIVMTVITAAEMRWSKLHGREALLAQLQAAGVGQFSVLDRESVVSLPEPAAHRVLSLPAVGVSTLDFSAVTSRDIALSLMAQGQLEKILSFPDRFGGEDVAMNQFFVPPGISALKDEVTEELVEAVAIGLIDNLSVEAEYKGSSFVPAKILVVGTHSTKDSKFTRTIEVW